MNKKLRILVLLAVLLCILLAACSEEKINYQVTVTNAAGAPYTKCVAVRFMQGDVQVGIQAVDENGVADMDLPADDYTVLLNMTDPEATYTYDAANLTLSASKPQLTVMLNRELGEESEPICIGEEEYTACFVSVGCTEFVRDAEKTTYVLFMPTEAGKYKFSLVDTEGPIGYYGTSFFPRAESLVQGSKSVSVVFGQDEIGENGFPAVLGIAPGAGKAILSISHVADAEDTKEMSWSTDWKTGHQASDKCRVEQPNKLRYFDITAKSGKYKLFYDETSGYYRTKENGPVILVALGKNNNPKFQTVGLYERVCGNGMYGGSDVVRYFYNENKELEKREKYTDFLLETFEHAGITAYDQEVYHPLTKDLMYVLQNAFADWWNVESPDFQEVFAKANAEYAWLYFCCYEK